MATLEDSLTSSSARKLPLRKRADLTAHKQRYQGRTYWVVKEPIGMKYFRFQEEEYALLEMLDGQMSLDELKQRFEEKFPPRKITVDQLHDFISMLHQSGLVVTNASGQGVQLLNRFRKRRAKEWKGRLTNILAIRTRGIDPDRILELLYPYCRWMFSPAVVIPSLLFALAALLLVIVQFDTFQSRLPSFHQFFGPSNWLFLIIALGVTKVLHEFGHGMTCKHFGGECHEMGLMLLVLTPCLYCDVSDSWTLPSKWRRAAIGAAGIYVEIVIASVCTFIWWFSTPGLLNHLCLSTMFIASVSTLLFNGNPLLRYDGYYILSDLIEIPNLREKSNKIFTNQLSRWCLGLDIPPDPFLPHRNKGLFITYAIAAALYRWFVLLMILVFLNKMFEPYNLKVIGQMIAIASLFSLVGMPMWKMFKFFRTPGTMDRVKSNRVVISLAVVGFALLFVLLIPLPHRIIAPLEIQPRDPHLVTIEVPGTLQTVYVSPGRQVAAGERLAQLSDIDLELQITQLVGQQRQYETRLKNLRQQRFHDEQALAEISEMRELLATVQEQLAGKLRDLDRLTLKAPVGGTVMRPASHQPATTDNMLATWSGTPLDEKNRGAFLSQQDLFCKIGDTRNMEAILFVDQYDIEFIREGQAVDVQLDQMPGTIYAAVVESVSPHKVNVSSSGVSVKSGGELATKTDEAGRERPMSTTYRVVVSLAHLGKETNATAERRLPQASGDAASATDTEVNDIELTGSQEKQNPPASGGQLLTGFRGRGKIHTGSMSLGKRLWRYLAHTFHFTL